MPADPPDGGSEGHVWLQEHFQEVLALPGDPQVPRNGDASLLLVQHLGDVSVIEGQVGTEQGIEDDTHAPDVGLAAVVGHALQHLRRRVGCAATEGPAQLSALPGEQLGEAKICQLQGVALQQGILTLEVTVGHPVVVAVLDGLNQLAEERPGMGLGQGTLVEHVVKDIPVLRQLHHKIDLPLCRLQHLVHTDDVPVVQARDDLELPGQESLNKVCRERGGGFAHRDVPELLALGIPLGLCGGDGSGREGCSWRAWFLVAWHHSPSDARLCWALAVLTVRGVVT